MALNDRFTRGLIAGIIAGLVSFSWGLLSRHVLHFTTLLYSDFAAILTYGAKAQSLQAKIFAQLVVFMFWGFGGILFAYFIKYVGSKNIVLKGAFWGTFTWFISYVITLLFKVPGLEKIPTNTAVSQFIGSLAWGIPLAFVFNYLDKKLDSHS